MQDHDRIIELIAKSLDEPLTAPEQAQVEQAVQESLALRIAADGLREFDALLRRTGMAIPEEGFPARFLLRLEMYEKRRTRTEWLFTLGILFLGSFAAAFWLVFNWAAVINTLLFVIDSLLILTPLLLAVLFAIATRVGQESLLLYAIVVLMVTVLWARASGGMHQVRA